MATITLRNVKGSPLTHTEVDDNFSSLKIGADIAEAGTSDNNPNTLVKRDAAGKATLSTLEATQDVITNSIGQSAAQQHTVPAVASDTLTLNAATQTLTNKTLTSPVVTGGSINNTPIGATTPNTGAFTTVSTTGNATVGGDIAVNGGDLTSTATTFNLLNSNVTTLNLAGAATSLTIATSTATTTVNIATGATLSGSTKSVNLGTGGASGSTTNVSVGSTNGGSTTLNSPSVNYSGEILTTSTSALQVPVGPSAQQPAGANGKIRYNTTLSRYEGYSSALGDWGALGGGAKGGGADQVFYENDKVVTQNYTLTSGKNAMTAGPVSINDGVSVTVPDGSVWTIV